MTLFKKFALRIGQWPPDSDAKRQVVLMYLTAGASEVYLAEPSGLLQEMKVENGGSKYLTIPAHVGEIRGVRSCDGKTAYFTIGQRYTASGDWGQHTKDFRSLGTRGAKTTNYDATGGITVHLLAAEPTSQVTVSVTGRTLTANKQTVSVTFEPGETAKAITWPFVDDFTARKDIVTAGNVELRTEDDTVICEILNDMLESRYLAVEIGHKCCTCDCENVADIACWEVLFKPRWEEFRDENDSFIVDGFDDVIIMKALEHYTYGNVAASDGIQLAQTLNLKAAGIMEGVQSSADKGKDAYIDFGPPRSASQYLKSWK